MKYDPTFEGHRCSFEGATTQMAEHMIAEHDGDLDQADLERCREMMATGGFSQSDWTTMDRIHHKAHGYGDGSGYPGSTPIIVASSLDSNTDEEVTVTHPLNHAAWAPVAAILSTPGVSDVVVSYGGDKPSIIFQAKGLHR